FMTSLAQREANNYQFDFLSPNHTLFGYFRRLVDQYSLILFPPDDLTRGLERDQEDKYQILDRINRRMKWEAYEEEERKKREEEAAKEKEAYLSIDWHDFVVVGAVEFVEEDVYVDLPEPLKLQDLTNMSLEDKRKAKAEGSSAGEDAGASKGNAGASEEEHAIEDMDQEEDEDNDVEMEMDEDDEDDEDIDEEIEAERNPNAPAAVTVQTSAISVGPMKIRKDYVPNLRRGPQTSEVTLQCQLCKLEIPASEFEEHIRVELIDPKWKEQKLIYERKIRDSNLVQEGMDIAKYLGQMAAHRSNISSGNERPEEDEEAASASANASTQNRVYWDGYSSSAGQATRRARENMSVDEQIAAIHHKKGVAGPNGGTPEIGPQTGPPAAKRQRTSQDQ
ncbi:SF3a splicing factor complex subunit, partial [Dipsacomyces acuminosporus]